MCKFQSSYFCSELKNKQEQWSLLSHKYRNYLVHPRLGVMLFKQMKTAELILHLNFHQQMYHYEELFSILCLVIVSPRVPQWRIQCIFHIENERVPKCSPKCGHPHLVKYGFRIRDFVDLPIGAKKVILRMKVRRYKGKCADCAMIARNGYLLPPAVTVLHSSLCNVCGWPQERSNSLRRSGQGSRCFSSILEMRQKKIDIRYIATDLSSAFISSVHKNCPNAVHVFDHLHVVKLMNEKLDDIRK